MIKETNGNGARLKITARKRPGFNVYGSTNKHDKLKNLGFEECGHTGFQKELTFDPVPTENSNNPVASGGIYELLKNKVGTDDRYVARLGASKVKHGGGAVEGGVLVFDRNNKYETLALYVADGKPKSDEDSYNLITSKAVYDALEKKVDKAEGMGLSHIQNVFIFDDGTGAYAKVGIELVNQEGITFMQKYFYTADQINQKLSELPQGGGVDLETVKAYIEETLLGGAW